MKLVVMTKYNKGLKKFYYVVVRKLFVWNLRNEVVLSVSDLKLSVCEKVN